MLLFFTIIIIAMCVCIGTLFALSKHTPAWYASFRSTADIKVAKATQRVYKYTFANQSIYRHQISQKSKLLLIAFLKRIYIVLQYIVRFIRRNIIMTAKKVKDSEPNEMLQELKRERDRIMSERSQEGK